MPRERVRLVALLATLLSATPSSAHPLAPALLQIRELPVPVPDPGWVLIEVKAFGLNRSELFTRLGHSPGVAFPPLVLLLALHLSSLRPRDVILFGKYPSGSGFEDGEQWFGWNFRISGLFRITNTNTDILFEYRIRIQYV